jgi:hypothetical protein
LPERALEAITKVFSGTVLAPFVEVGERGEVGAGSYREWKEKGIQGLLTGKG